MDVAALEAAGLYDPAAPDAADGLELFRFLEAQGASIDEMVEARRRGRLVSLPLDRALRDRSASLTLAGAAAQAGLDQAAAARARQSVGLPRIGPDDDVLGRADVEMLRVVQAANGVFGEEVTLQLGRVIGSSVNRIAEAEVAAFLLNIATPLAAEDAPELVVARANAEVAAMIPQVSRLIELLHRRHLDDAVHRFTMSGAELAGDQTVDLSVGFADLVGFTALSQQLSTRELAASIAAFESRTAEIVAENDGRLVKLIGDEVMYVADDPGAICQVTVALLDAFDGGDILPPLRAGLACGPVLVRDGDYFGPVVNIASRSAKLGRPRTALVTPDVRTRSPEPPPGYRYGPARPRRLKGFDRRVPLHTLRRERTRRHPLRAVEAILGAGAEP